MTSMHKRLALGVALTLAAVSLTGCLVEPAPYYGGQAYYAPAPPVYVGPSVYFGGGYGGYGGYHRGGGWGGGGGGHWHHH